VIRAMGHREHEECGQAVAFYVSARCNRHADAGQRHHEHPPAAIPHPCCDDFMHPAPHRCSRVVRTGLALSRTVLARHLAGAALAVAV
jgi:hypothetical protein